jgi:hypothetical protein
MEEDERPSVLQRAVDQVAALFNTDTDDKAAVGEKDRFTFEDRVALVADLLALKHNPISPQRVWANKVRSRLLEEPSFAPLAEGLKNAFARKNEVDLKARQSDGSPPEETRDEDVVNATIDAAIRLAERHPVSTFGRDVNALIAERIDKGVMKAAPVRIFRWGAPILLAGILGGTIFGIYQVDGLYKAMKEYRSEIDTEVRGFDTEAQKKLDSINTAGKTAVTLFQKSLDEEAKKQLGEMNTLIATEKANVVAAVRKETTEELPAFFSSEKTKYLDAQKNQGAVTLNSRVNEITNDFDSKQKQIKVDSEKLQEAIRNAEAAIPSRIKQINDQVKDLEPKVEQLKGLAEDTRELKRILETSPAGAGLSPSQLLTILNWKDYLSMSALFLSLATVVSVLAFRQTGWKHLMMTGFVLLALLLIGFFALEATNLYNKGKLFDESPATRRS